MSEDLGGGFSPGAASCRLPVLPWFGPEMWAGEDPPEREWLIEGWIPRGHGALLTGDGATGKSLLAQQLATCIAFERPFLGMPVPAGMLALYITCEDDRDELHRRQHAICRSLGVKLDEMPDRLFLASLRGELNNELINDRLEPTKTFHKLEATLNVVGRYGFVVLDNVAHLFGGNENDRHHVAVFLNLIERLAMQAKCTILLLGHPPKSGAQFSGSTAWENQARTRLFLKRPEVDEGFADPDQRVLVRSKANYARNGEAIEFRWQDWSFVLPEQARADWNQEQRENARIAQENERFLKLLDNMTAQGRAVSHSPRAGNYAPKILSEVPGARGMSQAMLRRAMERLFETKQIEASQPLWRGPNRTQVYGIARAQRLHDGSTGRRAEDSQAIENACTPVAHDGPHNGSDNCTGVCPECGRNPCASGCITVHDGSSRSGGGKNPPKGGSFPHHPLDPREDDDIEWGPL